jgi:hypothetical protein
MKLWNVWEYVKILVFPQWQKSTEILQSVDWVCNGWGMNVQKKMRKWTEYYDWDHHHQVVQIYFYQFVIYFLLYKLISLSTITSFCHLDLSITFAVFPNTLLLYMLSAYIPSNSYVSWLLCYKISGYVLYESQYFFSTPSEVLSGVPEESVIGL